MIRYDAGEPYDPSAADPTGGGRALLSVAYDPGVLTRDRYPEFHEALDRLVAAGTAERHERAPACRPRGCLALAARRLAADALAGAVLVGFLAAAGALPFADVPDRVGPAAAAVCAARFASAVVRAAVPGLRD